MQLQNAQSTSILQNVGTVAAWATPLAAIATVGVGWSKQRQDTRAQRERDREERRLSSAREFDAGLAATIANLGSDSVSLKASAASTLMIFVGPRYADYRENVLRVALANLKTSHEELVRRLLVEVLGAALSRTPQAQLGGWDLDLSEADLAGLTLAENAKLPDGVLLRGAKLGRARMAQVQLWRADLFRAVLDGADLRRSNLGQARMASASLIRSDLSGGRLASANLRGVDARYALFRGSELQSAHFEGADLRGARFEGANINDTYFLRARLDTDAVATLLKASNRQKAHFDESTTRRLASLAGGGKDS